jgi:hypothetical protein
VFTEGDGPRTRTGYSAEFWPFCLAFELLIRDAPARLEVLVKRPSRWIVPLAVVASCALLPAEASAQRRAVPRSSVRHVYPSHPVYRPYYRPYYYRPYYYAPYYAPYYYGGYAGWYSGFAIGFGFGYPYYYGGYPYPYAYPYYSYYTSSARLEVKPQHAEVYIDGYAVGTVDNFDGWAQRLDVEPGEHELTIYLPGHRTYRQPVLFRPGATIKIGHVMQPLAPGDAEEPRPTPAPKSSRPSYRRDDDQPPPPSRSIQVAPPAGAQQPSNRDVQSQDYGGVAIRVQPADAEVIVDGERWDSPAGDVTLQLTEGTHRVEVRKAGYRVYTADVRVRRGETTSVNVSLSRQ